MSDELVTVGSFSLAPQAESVRLLLEQEGVSAFIADENLVNTNWFLGPAVGYIKVQVLQSELEEAKKILQEHPTALGPVSDETENAPLKCMVCGETMGEEVEVCPKCGWTFEETPEPAPESGG
jgi:rubrerythrin